MDIAKIRKKLKKPETDKQQSYINGKDKQENLTKVTSPDKKPSKPEPCMIEEQSAAPCFEVENNQEQKPVNEEEIGEKNQDLRAGRVVEKNEIYNADELIEILSFNLLKEEFAFKISQLEEILKPQKITKVPKTPEYVMGITSVRGKVIPVIDLKLKLSLTDKASPLDHKGKILILKGPKGKIGAAVDKITGVMRIEKNEIQPPPSHLTETELRFIDGVAIMDKRFISIINMEEVTEIKLK